MNHTIEVLTADRDYQLELLRTYKSELINLPEGRLQYREQGSKIYVYRRIDKAKKKNCDSLQHVKSSSKSIRSGGPIQPDKTIKTPRSPQSNKTSKSNKSKEYSQPSMQVVVDIRELVKRKFFILKSIPILEKNIKTLDRCMKSYKVYDADSICSSLGKAYESIPMSKTFYEGIDSNSRLWQEFKSNQNTYFDVELKHKLDTDSKVRSKSEAVIHTLLVKYGIDFKYEACLNLGKIKFYPDFLILDQLNNKIIIWEHFGMINDKSYVERMENKLATYRVNGITLWNNLIITFDKENGSLDISQIEKIIKLFLCNNFTI